MLDHGLDLAELARRCHRPGRRLSGYGRRRWLAGIRCFPRRGARSSLRVCGGRHAKPLCPRPRAGSPYPRQSVYAFRDAIERRVDYATVNDRFFVNNVSLGVYATIVQQEGYREAKAATTWRLLPELLGDTTEPFDLSVRDARRH